jgi:hypothetical protein
VGPYTAREALYKLVFAQLSAKYTRGHSDALVVVMYGDPAPRVATTISTLVPYLLSASAVVSPRGRSAGKISQSR